MASKTLRELTIKLDADVAELKKGLAKANKQMTGFQKRMKGLGSSFKNIFSVVAVGAVANQIGEVIGEMATLGKELEGVKQGFQGIDPKILDDMRKATHGTVTDLELMKAAVQAKNFGLPLKEMGTMLEFVHRRARASGESVDFLTRSLVTGLGRKSSMIIDNLGISTSQLNEQLKLTPDFTTAVAEIMKRDMKASGEYIETAADITERWAAEWGNTKAKVGLFINKGIKLIAPVLDKAKQSMKEFFSDSMPKIIDFINSWITLYNESIIFRAAIVSLKTTFNVMWSTFKGTINLMVSAIKGLGKSIMFVLTPKNWGKGFELGLKKIMFDAGKEMESDALKMGKESGEAVFDGITELTHGKKDLISKETFGTEAVAEMTQAASDAGTETGKAYTSALAANMKDLQKKMKVASKGGGATDNLFLADDEEMDTAANEIIENVQEVSNKVQLAMSSVNNFLSDSFAQLGQNIGKSLSGTGKLLDGFMNILLNFGEQFGKIMIGIGVAKLALENIGISGIGAIVAGVALIAGISAIKGLMDKGPGFAKGGIVPGSSFSGDNVPINTNSGELILNRAQQSNVAGQLTGGGGGRLSVEVSGAALKFVLDEANRMDNNSF